MLRFRNGGTMRINVHAIELCGIRDDWTTTSSGENVQLLSRCRGRALFICISLDRGIAEEHYCVTSRS